MPVVHLSCTVPRFVHFPAGGLWCEAAAGVTSAAAFLTCRPRGLIMQDETKRDKERAAFTVTQTTYLLQQEVWEELPEGNSSARTTAKCATKSLGFQPRYFVVNVSVSLGLFLIFFLLYYFCTYFLKRAEGLFQCFFLFFLPF